MSELAQNVKIVIRTTIFENRKDKTKTIKKITSVLQLYDMVQTHNKYSTPNEIKNWQKFRKKIEDGKITVKQLHDALQLAS